MRLCAQAALLAWSVLAGCSAATPYSSQEAATSSLRGTKSKAEYEKLAAKLDDPQGIFTKVGFDQTWTLTPDKAKITFPTNFTIKVYPNKDGFPLISPPGGKGVIPHESRNWEPWFRSKFTNQGVALSTAVLEELRDASKQAARADPRLDPARAPALSRDQMDKYWEGQLEQVRVDILKSLHLDSPSSPLVQLSRCHIVAYWAATHFTGGGDAVSEKYCYQYKRWPTANEMLTDFGGKFSCSEFADLPRSLLRGMEATAASRSHGTGIEAYHVRAIMQPPGWPQPPCLVS